MDQRRRHLRVGSTGNFAELRVQGASVGLYTLADVSDSGVFMECPHPVVPVGTPVQLVFVEASPPFTLDGRVVQARRGAGAGYGIELALPPDDVVERVMRPPPPPTPTARPTPAHAVSAPRLAEPRSERRAPVVVVVGEPGGAGQALAQSLTAFGTEAAHVATAAAAVELLERDGAAVRAILAELRVFETGTATPVQKLRAGAPKARVLLVVSKLPDADARAGLLRQGADELLLSPFDPFAVMAKVRDAASRRGR